jgi:hypothetical protein
VLRWRQSSGWSSPRSSAAPGRRADPPGNNGTVKVDGVVFDDDPNNEPHVDCIFQIDWYGFDEGDFLSHVTFEVRPPTGKPVVLLEDDVFIGEDDNSGGGSEAGLDASETTEKPTTTSTPGSSTSTT